MPNETACNISELHGSQQVGKWLKTTALAAFEHGSIELFP
jgi:hypothetical protein